MILCTSNYFINDSLTSTGDPSGVHTPVVGRPFIWGWGMPEFTLIHGFARRPNRIPEYGVWIGMKKRCSNPNQKAYPAYGGRGIKVCDIWRNDFQAFFDDMGPRPSKDHSLDRVDNDGNYEPSNCRWATRKQQMRNTSRNHMITYKGETRTMIEWAEIYKIPLKSVWYRINSGWPIEDALTKPLMNKNAGICISEGCYSKQKSLSMCLKHYQRTWRTRPSRLIIDARRCAVEGCANVNRTKGFCGRHYKQFRKGVDMSIVTQDGIAVEEAQS